jgi:hypothetical protein
LCEHNQLDDEFLEKAADPLALLFCRLRVVFGIGELNVFRGVIGDGRSGDESVILLVDEGAGDSVGSHDVKYSLRQDRENSSMPHNNHLASKHLLNPTRFLPIPNLVSAHFEDAACVSRGLVALLELGDVGQATAATEEVEDKACNAEVSLHRGV